MQEQQAQTETPHCVPGTAVKGNARAVGGVYLGDGLLGTPSRSEDLLGLDVKPRRPITESCCHHRAEQTVAQRSGNNHSRAAERGGCATTLCWVHVCTAARVPVHTCHFGVSVELLMTALYAVSNSTKYVTV